MSDADVGGLWRSTASHRSDQTRLCPDRASLEDGSGGAGISGGTLGDDSGGRGWRRPVMQPLDAQAEGGFAAAALPDGAAADADALPGMLPPGDGGSGSRAPQRGANHSSPGGSAAVVKALRFGCRSIDRLSGDTAEGLAGAGHTLNAQGHGAERWQRQSSKPAGTGGGGGCCKVGGECSSGGTRLSLADASNNMSQGLGGDGGAEALMAEISLWEQQAERPDPEELPAAPAAAGAAAAGGPGAEVDADSAADSIVQHCESVFSFL